VTAGNTADGQIFAADLYRLVLLVVPSAGVLQPMHLSLLLPHSALLCDLSLLLLLLLLLLAHLQHLSHNLLLLTLLLLLLFRLAL
jgi:hypothetical protein